MAKRKPAIRRTLRQQGRTSCKAGRFLVFVLVIANKEGGDRAVATSDAEDDR